jgi:hypothetical protein
MDDFLLQLIAEQISKSSESFAPPKLGLADQRELWLDTCEILEGMGPAVTPVQFLAYLDDNKIEDPTRRQQLLMTAITIESSLERLTSAETETTVH